MGTNLKIGATPYPLQPAQMTDAELASKVARLYDLPKCSPDRESYRQYYAELVRRVGQDKAEEMVEAA